MLLRFLVKFLFLSIVLIAIVLFGSKWKLNKELEKAIARAQPFAEIKYESAKINLSGKITIDSISAYFPLANESIEVSQLTYSHGNLYSMLFSSPRANDELLENAHLTFENFLIPFGKLDNKLKQFNIKPEPTSWSILSTAYCGKINSISLQTLDRIGYNYLSLSGNLDYRLDKYSGSAIIRGLLDIADLNKIDYQINLGNVIAWKESMQERAIGQTAKKVVQPNIELLDLHIKDQGYNEKWAGYCSIREGVSPDDYYLNHPSKVEELLANADIKMSNSLKLSYSQLIKPNSLLHWYMEPKVGFDIERINDYSFLDFFEQTGLQIKVNDKPVDSFFDTWSSKRFAMIAETVEKDTIVSSEQNGQMRRVFIKKSFEPVSINRINRFVNYRAVFMLKDKREYKGRITKTNSKNLWIKISKDGGYVTLPIERSEIKKILVEVNKKVDEEK